MAGGRDSCVGECAEERAGAVVGERDGELAREVVVGRVAGSAAVGGQEGGLMNVGLTGRTRSVEDITVH